MVSFTFFMRQNQEINSVTALFDQLRRRDRSIDCLGLTGSERAYLVSRIYDERQMPVMVLAPTAKAAERFIEDLHFFGPTLNSRILYFPPYNILPYKSLSYHSETAAKRIGVLYRLLERSLPSIVVTTIDAVMQKIIPGKVISRYAELIVSGEEVDRDQLIEKLVAGGYLHAAVVEEPGDFSIRGGILDVFSPLYPHPLRIEFFGDFIESLRFFSAASQRRIKNVEEAVILPAKEAVLEKAYLPEIISRIRTRASEMNVRITRVREVVDNVKSGQGFAGIENLMPLIYPELGTFFDYIPDGTLFALLDSEKLENTAEAFEEQTVKNFEASCEAERFCVVPKSLYLTKDRVWELVAENKPLRFKHLEVLKAGDPQGPNPLNFKVSINYNTDISTTLKNTKKTENPFKPFAEWLAARRRGGCSCLVVCRTRVQAESVQSLLAPYGMQPAFIENFSLVKRNAAALYLTLGHVSSGFVWQDEALAIITEEELFGIKSSRRKIARQKPISQLLDIEDLKQSDLVVHDEHGIGQYDGLVKLSFNGITNDFLAIIYKDGDKLYLPVDRMGMVQKYMGIDNIVPALDKMGGRSWERVRNRVKRSAEKIAGELLKLYARRKVETGFAFKAGDGEIREFEVGFEYEETADQVKAIEDTLDDMQQPTPMDRLICGDVGYGKTEVALRASFLAVTNGKQVAMLVPTTILAEQHYATFCRRFERYPINISCLSRFRSAVEQRAILDGLKTGKIDIVIGTHRLLQKDVSFKDIGLLVLDEEQRFGVKHKEKLKKIRSSVDVLTLTATPIPRTLHLSLMGIRDISIISTPPEYRQSIMTYISEFDDALISEAVRKELNRDGQIFFVHNNIHSIEKMAQKIKRLVPEVRLKVAHARLDESQLEGVMYEFMKKEIDMLVCTSIIESGLDIPSANTIIVNRADRFGLAQIYQLRGRVGRADEQAYAYLLIPHESSLSRDAQKRLKVLMEHSDLGSGFQIAMNDLKIRGGGTILGASQSGHIAAVGYDMFLRLMENAVAELKGEPLPQIVEPEINVKISAFFSESYIPDLDQRLIAYRRLARMTELEEIDDFKSELVDRYGALPEASRNLLIKIGLKVLAQKASIARLDLTDQQIILQFSDSNRIKPGGLVDMVMSQPRRFEFTPGNMLKAKLSGSGPGGPIAEIKNILKEIAQRVSS
jgi:transcription-repair coupling factor (superfamily II helicase)